MLMVFRRTCFSFQVTEEEEDPTLYPKFLLSFTSTDDIVVEDFFSFVQKAAKMVEIEMTKAYAGDVANVLICFFSDFLYKQTTT